MNAVAIICEYNPFHSGHAYHIAQAKALSGADCVLGMMSGFFTQRAEPAVVSPQIRALAALRGGMDIVAEMPAVFACSAGNIFARGAVRAISRIPFVKYLAIGAEDCGETIKNIAEVQCEQNKTYVSALKSALSAGMPYAAAITYATVSAAPKTEDCEQVLSKPNNVLAVEYLKAIYELKCDIAPVFVKRLGNGYNNTETVGEHISATAARELLMQKRYDELQPYVPKESFELLIDEFERYPVNEKLYEALSVHALRTKNIANAFDSAEGLDIKISENAAKYASLSQIIAKSKSKRYTMSRIKRICLQTLLGITGETVERSQNAAARLIAIKKARKSLINGLTGLAVKNADYSNLSDDALFSAQTDALAGSIYSLITSKDGNAFWNRKLITE